MGTTQVYRREQNTCVYIYIYVHTCALKVVRCRDHANNLRYNPPLGFLSQKSVEQRTFMGLWAVLLPYGIQGRGEQYLRAAVLATNFGAKQEVSLANRNLKDHINTRIPQSMFA